MVGWWLAAGALVGWWAGCKGVREARVYMDGSERVKGCTWGRGVSILGCLAGLRKHFIALHALSGSNFVGG